MSQQGKPGGLDCYLGLMLQNLESRMGYIGLSDVFEYQLLDALTGMAKDKKLCSRKCTLKQCKGDTFPVMVTNLDPHSCFFLITGALGFCYFKKVP